jgi:hypothetical protein
MLARKQHLDRLRQKIGMRRSVGKSRRDERDQGHQEPNAIVPKHHPAEFIALAFYHLGRELRDDFATVLERTQARKLRRQKYVQFSNILLLGCIDCQKELDQTLS